MTRDATFLRGELARNAGLFLDEQVDQQAAVAAIVAEHQPGAVDADDGRRIRAKEQENVKTLEEAKIIARSSDHDWVGEELFRLQGEVARLTALINTPRTDEFFEAVRIEAAHQIERWGVEHDAGKRNEDWVTLLIYLLGKAAKAHFDRNQPKLEHYVITTAAVALNWWRRLVGVSFAMRPGVDR